MGVNVRRDKVTRFPKTYLALGRFSLKTMAKDQLASLDIDQCLRSYDYHLPDHLIAQNPVIPRDMSRLLVVNAQEHHHGIFSDLTTLLKPGDLLVMNNSKVIPARLYGRKLNPANFSSPGSAVEILLLEPRYEDEWLALVKPGRRLKPGATIVFGDLDPPILKAKVIATDSETHGRILKFEWDRSIAMMDILETIGNLPFPPYIHSSQAQPDQYQTIYASQPGSVAAPTAGLHFTPALLKKLQHRGIQHQFVTLHVGIGTFRPVESDIITDHTMHSEWIQVPSETVEAITRTHKQGGRVIAVGTTTVRALESMAQHNPQAAFEGKSQLFIYPGYRWRVIDGLITNFHLPRSSLLMMVSALIGRQRLLSIYNDAIAQSYRFYSFGDAMLITPEAQKAHMQTLLTRG